MTVTAPVPLPAPPRVDRRIKPHRLLRFDLICRAAILCASTITGILAWFVPRSLTAQLLDDGGVIGLAVLVVLSVSTLIGWLDILVNDLLPDRFHWYAAKRHQHQGYALIAGLYLLQAYTSIGDSISVDDLLPLGYIGNAGIAAWYAWTTAVRGWHV